MSSCCNTSSCSTTEQSTTAAAPATEPRPARIFHPQADAVLTPDAAIVTLDMPGCKPDALDVTFDRGVLTIRGHVEPRRPRDEASLLLNEFAEGDYYRTFRIGFPVDSAAIAAEYANGVLTVRVPKHEVAKQRRVPVVIAN